MNWLIDHAAWLSSAFALFASVMLFLPLVALVGLARQFRQFGDLVRKRGLAPQEVEDLRQQMINEHFGDGQGRWIALAGVSFVLSAVLLLIALFAPS